MEDMRLMYSGTPYRTLKLLSSSIDNTYLRKYVLSMVVVNDLQLPRPNRSLSDQSIDL